MANRSYQCIQKLRWSCPGMLVHIDEQGFVVAGQANPTNGLTYWSVEDEEDCIFDPSQCDYIRPIVHGQVWSSSKCEDELARLESEGKKLYCSERFTLANRNGGEAIVTKDQYLNWLESPKQAIDNDPDLAKNLDSQTLGRGYNFNDFTPHYNLDVSWVDANIIPKSVSPVA